MTNIKAHKNKRGVPLFLLALAAAVILLAGLSTFALAGEADVINVVMSQSMDGTFYLDVTVRHDDTGWDHFANWWRVMTEDGKELGRRVLAHPHVGEQPFTRELYDLRVPEGVSVVIVEAHDKVHEYGGNTVCVDMTRERGEGFRVIKRKK